MYTYALPGSRRVSICIIYEGSSQGDEFIGDEHIQLLTHKHSTSYIRTDIYTPPRIVLPVLYLYTCSLFWFSYQYLLTDWQKDC